MDSNFRPNHIEDALIRIHRGQWFVWTDIKNKIYANLRLREKVWIGGELVSNPLTEIPSEEEVNNKLAELQADFDANEYKVNRQREYPSIRDLVVALYDTDDKAAVDEKRAAVKLKYPKG